MKKTLVALAVLAASGASFAQATITGGINYGYRATTVGGATGSDSSGLGVDGANIAFNATEDLGGGLTAAAQLKLDSGGIARGSVSGGDGFVSLTGGFGSFKLATVERDTDLSDTAGNVAGVYLDAFLYQDDTDETHDVASFSKAFGPVSVTVSHIEGTPVGIGSGAAGTSNQRQNEIVVGYSAGALNVEAKYGAFDNKTDGSVQSHESVITLAGNYDLGVVKLGAGYQTNKYSLGVSTDTVVSVSVPFGALTVGALWGNHKVEDGANGQANGTANGYGLGASYALSKRTGVYLYTRSADSNPGDAVRSTRTQAGVTHSF